jgi:hypothetical protein
MKTLHYSPVLAFLSIAVLSGCVVRPARVYYAAPPGAVVVTQAPPPPQVEVVPEAPGPGYVWIAGHWRWREGRYVWIRGHYDVPPRAGVVWIAPHYENRGGSYVLIEGAWR